MRKGLCKEYRNWGDSDADEQGLNSFLKPIIWFTVISVFCQLVGKISLKLRPAIWVSTVTAEWLSESHKDLSRITNVAQSINNRLKVVAENNKNRLTNKVLTTKDPRRRMMSSNRGSLRDYARKGFGFPIALYDKLSRIYHIDYSIKLYDIIFIDTKGMFGYESYRMMDILAKNHERYILLRVVTSNGLRAWLKSQRSIITRKKMVNYNYCNPWIRKSW